ncbi:OprD family porin [Pseudomonas typographi]|uniref:OprD family porin n=1 Tax=Pseudomonas typographi TaxID=2715964 RepID=UPI001689B6D3|nr:OprD family porin [Pseudomonas typographi]MBD1550424.1 OprD family porin [Pseudomonas typographi]
MPKCSVCASICALFCCAGCFSNSLAVAGQEQAKGLVEDSHLSLLARNFYFNRDFRHGSANSAGANQFKSVGARNGYAEEWAQGFIANYTSGFTQGLFGVGLDAQALLGLKLDSGGGRAGLALMPIDGDGHPEDNFSALGAALKGRVSNTVIKYGQQLPNVPIFSTSTVRLLPSSATGWSLASNELKGLTINYGRFTSVRGVDSSNHDAELTTDYGVGITSRKVEYLGGLYNVNERLSLSFYASDFKDVWHQYYGYLRYGLPLSDNQALDFTLNAYRTHDYGKRLGGSIDNKAFSLAVDYRVGPHTFTAGYQKIFGDEPLDWVGFGTMGGNVTFTNASQFSTFAEPNERSWQLRYRLNMVAFGIPGLTFMVNYTKGDHMDNSHSSNPFYTRRFVYDPDKNNKHWERNLEAAYVVQSGPAKDLSLRLRHASQRATTGIRHPDVDELRIIIEYPLNLF